MKFIHYFLIVVTCLTLLVGLTNSVAPSMHGSGTVPSQLKTPRLFYRAVYKADIQSIGKTYVKGKSPPDHRKDAGDFAPQGTGGFYIFDNELEARTWGRCYSDGTSYKAYHVATFQYTPNKKLKTKSFASSDANWLKFVENNYNPKTKNSPFDIVEGPISAPFYEHGKKTKVGFSNTDGRLVWQGAFISPAALKTLVMTDIKQYPVSNNQGLLACCPNCVMQ